MRALPYTSERPFCVKVQKISEQRRASGAAADEIMEGLGKAEALWLAAQDRLATAEAG